MKKIKIELKYIMIVLVVIAGVLLAVSGNFSETKTMTAYKTTVNGSDSARVAKWDVVGVSRKNAQEMQLTSGFAEEITSEGNWYFEISNLSEVNAMISKNSTVTFRLMHESFASFVDDEISWDFLDGKINEIKFELYAYNQNIDDILVYEKGTEQISYDDFMNLEEQAKVGYTEKFIGSSTEEKLICEIKSSMSNKFLKMTSKIDGVNQTYYELTFDFRELTDDQSLLGFGGTRQNTTFRLYWYVPVQCTTHVDNDSDDECDRCHELMSSSTFAYSKYIISDTTNNIEGYTIYSDENNPVAFKDGNGNTKYIFKSDPVDFFSYQKYTSTLGGEPMYEFLNAMGTQTLLIAHNKLSDQEKTTINGYDLTSNSDVDKAWERLTYEEYERFSANYNQVQNSLSYMSYGISMQIIFNLSVEQVD